jgi:hypothetical protein
MPENERGALADRSTLPDRGPLASSTVVAHLTRGAIGFGLIGAALALTPSHGPAALLFAPLGLLALRGCPTCWIVGLIETISAGRPKRTCTENGCTLASGEPLRSPGDATSGPGSCSDQRWVFPR